MQDYFTPRQIARQLRVVPQNVYAWVWSGVLPAIQNPETRCWLISRNDFDNFKQNWRRKAARETDVSA
jgi:hypothetical protein